MPHDFDTNHHFTGTQQEEYDSLNAKARSHYDRQRWYNGMNHKDAFETARAGGLGLKSAELVELERQLAMIQNGEDPRVTWR